MSYLLSKINLQTTQLCRNLPSIAFQHCFRASWLYFGPGMTAWPQSCPYFIFELHCIFSNSFSSHSPLSHLALKEKSLQKKSFCSILPALSAGCFSAGLIPGHAYGAFSTALPFMWAGDTQITPQATSGKLYLLSTAILLKDK